MDGSSIVCDADEMFATLAEIRAVSGMPLEHGVELIQRLGDRRVQFATDLRFSIEHHQCCKTTHSTLLFATCMFANRISSNCERPTWEEQRLGVVDESAFTTRRIA
jgi:hypothetical protein